MRETGCLRPRRGHDASDRAGRAEPGKLEREGNETPLTIILDQVEEVFAAPHHRQPTQAAPRQDRASRPRAPRPLPGDQEVTDFLEPAKSLFGQPEPLIQGKLILCFRKEWSLSHRSLDSARDDDL